MNNNPKIYGTTGTSQISVLEDSMKFVVAVACSEIPNPITAESTAFFQSGLPLGKIGRPTGLPKF